MIQAAKRIVVKVGTSTVTHMSGGLNLRCIETLTRVLCDLKNMGKDVLLVSSGAVGVGAGSLNLGRERTLVERQAAAAVGQCTLMNIYEMHFARFNQTVAQILLTRDVFDDEERSENAKNTLNLLLSYNIIPIVNENDVVSTVELEFGDNDALSFGDNDTLSAMVAVACNADGLIVLSDINGLYDSDPNKNSMATLIEEVNEITPYIEGLATGSITANGTGGMITKLEAAKLAMHNGCDMVIANGANPRILYDIFDGKNVGTRFNARFK